MIDTAFTIPMFSRTDKLERLLQSADKTGVKKVYIADNGKMTTRKSELYEGDWNFDIDVFDLDYDSGVGNCRRELVNQTTESVLFFLDPDMHVPQNYEVLINQLEANPHLGAISGMIQESGRIFTTASDIRESEDIIYRDISNQKSVKYGPEGMMVEFDFIPQVGAFRRECVEDYNWDAFYRTEREHIDFFVGHKRMTEWDFGINPTVFFPHFPGGSSNYESHRKSRTKRSESHKYFCGKWNCSDLVTEAGVWVDTYPYYRQKGKIAQLLEEYNKNGAVSACSSGLQYLHRLLNR